MKKHALCLSTLCFSLLFGMSAYAHASSITADNASLPTTQSQETSVMTQTITLRKGKNTLEMVLVNNAATRKLLALANDKPLSITMHQYGGFEMVGELPETLPTDNHDTQTSAGDVVLYNGNQLVIFYGSNRWSYTRLGKIRDASSHDIQKFFGSDQATIELSVNEQN